jgi:hypothetical protein
LHFPTSHKKIQRAKKHIDDIHTLLMTFAKSDFYAARIDNDSKRGTNFLCLDIRDDLFPVDDAALIIGDALHNLRSALDFMYYQIVLACGGTPSNWTRFPVFNTGDKLESWLASALEKKQITEPIVRLIRDDIKPYDAGNPLIFSLHQLNISDKHEFFVPVLKFMGLVGVRLEDDKGNRVGSGTYLTEESCRIRLRDADDRIVTVKNKGQMAPAILFGIDTPFQNQSVIVSLARIAEEVTRTVEVFEWP